MHIHVYKLVITHRQYKISLFTCHTFQISYSTNINGKWHIKIQCRKTRMQLYISAMNMSHDMGFPTMWYVRQQRLRPACAYAQSGQSLCKSPEHSVTVKLLTEQYLGFLSLKGGCTGSPESTFVKMTLCWKSHVTAQIGSRVHLYFQYKTKSPNTMI